MTQITFKLLCIWVLYKDDRIGGGLFDDYIFFQLRLNKIVVAARYV